MDRAIFRKAGVTLYEGVSASGLKYVLAPVPGLKTKVFGLLVNKGGLDDIVSIGGTKIPAGVAHFLEHRMFETPQGDGLVKLRELGAEANAYTDRSSTFYYFSTTGEWAQPLDFLLGMVTDFSMSAEKVEKEKPIIIGELASYLDQPDYLFAHHIVESLYEHQPVRREIIGTPASIKQTHLSALKKFFLSQYNLDNMMLFAAGGFDPQPVVEALDRFKFTNKFPPLEAKGNVETKEDYSRVAQPLTTLPSPDGETYLGVGIKFPPRRQLYEKYGDPLFAIYELLPALVTSAVLKPIDALRAEGLIIFETYDSFEQAGEDAFLSVLYETNAPDKLREKLSPHFANPQAAIQPLSGELRALQAEYFGQVQRAVGNPFALADSLVDAYQNHFAWPALAESALALTEKQVRGFLKDLAGWPQAYIQLQGHKEH